MNKRYLITGGAGFIGSHLSQRLIAAGHSVVVLDDVSTGAVANLAGLMGNPNFQFVRDSVESEPIVNLLMSECDVVFHLASAVGVRLIVEQPVRTIRTTIHGTEVVLEAAYRFNRPTLVTSSSEVYGKGMTVPFSEDDDVVMGATIFNRWCYAYGKAIDEFLGLAYHRQYGLPVRIVRLFNTVGPRQLGQYGMVLPRFVASAIANEPVVVYGDGSQTRCFCHVHDVADALIKLMETPAAIGKVFNVGSDQEISINGLAERVIQRAGSRSKLEHISYEKAYGQAFDDLPRRVPNLSRLRAAIPFGPHNSLDQIIDAVIAEQRAAAAKKA
ncbi:MAG: GDP-mannose 4,6-dehydratase [Planctomycetota bacterium]|nr:GDP-mannose 4,6-dehydratase [Planctomycetota bacterium]